MNRREWLSWVYRSSYDTLVSGSLVFVVLFHANNLSNARAQETIKPTSSGGHVEELALYLDHLEVGAPVVCRQLAVFPLRLRDGNKLRGLGDPLVVLILLRLFIDHCFPRSPGGLRGHGPSGRPDGGTPGLRTPAPRGPRL